MSRRLERNQTGGGTQRGGLRLGRVPWTRGAWRLWEVFGGFGFCGLEDHVEIKGKTQGFHTRGLLDTWRKKCGCRCHLIGYEPKKLVPVLLGALCLGEEVVFFATTMCKCPLATPPILTISARSRRWNSFLLALLYACFHRCHLPFPIFLFVTFSFAVRSFALAATLLIPCLIRKDCLRYQLVCMDMPISDVVLKSRPALLWVKIGFLGFEDRFPARLFGFTI